jgi:hypothetical protein
LYGTAASARVVSPQPLPPTTLMPDVGAEGEDCVPFGGWDARASVCRNGLSQMSLSDETCAPILSTLR